MNRGHRYSTKGDIGKVVHKTTVDTYPKLEIEKEIHERGVWTFERDEAEPEYVAGERKKKDEDDLSDAGGDKPAGSELVVEEGVGMAELREDAPNTMEDDIAKLDADDTMNDTNPCADADMNAGDANGSTTSMPNTAGTMTVRTLEEENLGDPRERRLTPEEERISEKLFWERHDVYLTDLIWRMIDPDPREDRSRGMPKTSLLQILRKPFATIH